MGRRIIYIAVAYFPEASRARVLPLLRGFDAALSTGRPAAEAANLLPLARAEALAAALAVRAFEEHAAQECGAEALLVSTPKHSDCVALQNRGAVLFDEALGAAANEVGQALAVLLSALGGEDVFYANRD